MKTPTDILTTLNGLSADDRTWIIDRLSAQSKSRLLANTTDAPASAARPSQVPTAATSTDALGRAEATALARVLKHEPAWLITALIYAREWSWRTELLDTLAPVTRSEVQRLHQAGGSFTSAFIETLAGLVLSRLDERVDVHPASAFETVIARLRASRSRKRLTLHL